MLIKCLITSAFVVLVLGDDICDPKKCYNIIEHYRELKCKPIGDECCPKRFVCPDFEKIDDNKCYYKGVEYNDGDVVKDPPRCTLDCRCRKFSDVAQTSCITPECPEHFNHNLRGCVPKISSIDKCCGKNFTCDPDEIEKLHKCVYDGIDYRKGQLIRIPIGCYSCVCDEGFDVKKLETNPSCKKTDCAFSIYSWQKIKKGCAPMYSKNSQCCPYTWKCPGASDKVLPATDGDSSDDPEMSCKFGPLNVKLNEYVSDSDECVKCRCAVPPMVTCVKIC